MEHACNAMSKNYPIVLPFPAFSEMLRNAVDSIGAFSLLNPEWAKIADAEGVPIPEPPEFGADKYGIYGESQYNILLILLLLLHLFMYI